MINSSVKLAPTYLDVEAHAKTLSAAITVVPISDLNEAVKQH